MERTFGLVTETKAKPKSYCSFCGKDNTQVKKLLAGPTAFICDECVELCASVLQEAGIKISTDK